MIITIQELLDCGLPISDEIDDAKLQMAIETAEQYIIKPRLGNELYAGILDDPTDYNDILEGGYITDGDRSVYLSGLKKAEYHLAFAILLNMNVNATTFGSVEKIDEYSKQADDSAMRRVGMTNTDIGMQYLKEITDWLKIDNSGKNLPNIIWSEFL